eukprot:GFYU01017808.1.p1 GENE.GFYU01017808.1~~GFYU01017808.1.p1  ORF type:complete len:254 (-),score=50.04 GFYU01017808.1:143-904(-)
MTTVRAYPYRYLVYAALVALYCLPTGLSVNLKDAAVTRMESAHVHQSEESTSSVNAASVSSGHTQKRGKWFWNKTAAEVAADNEAAARKAEKVAEQKKAAYRKKLEKEYNFEKNGDSIPFPWLPNGESWKEAVIEADLAVRDAEIEFAQINLKLGDSWTQFDFVKDTMHGKKKELEMHLAHINQKKVLLKRSEVIEKLAEKQRDRAMTVENFWKAVMQVQTLDQRTLDGDILTLQREYHEVKAGERPGRAYPD